MMMEHLDSLEHCRSSFSHDEINISLIQAVFGSQACIGRARLCSHGPE